MLSVVSQYNFKIDSYLADINRKASITMIGEFLLKAVSRHMDERNMGYYTMLSKQCAWVLSRMAIEMNEYPKNGETIIIKTWIADSKYFLTDRFFSIENEQGKEIGFAKSLWVSIDNVSRKPINLSDIKSIEIKVDNKKYCPIENTIKVSGLKNDYILSNNFIVRYNDMDINNHLNSIKCIEHFIDIFDIDMFSKKDIKRIDINYITEGHYNENIQILKRQENDLTFHLEMRNNNTSICTCKIKWG